MELELSSGMLGKRIEVDVKANANSRHDCSSGISLISGKNVFEILVQRYIPEGEDKGCC